MSSFQEFSLEFEIMPKVHPTAHCGLKASHNSPQPGVVGVGVESLGFGVQGVEFRGEGRGVGFEGSEARV